MYANRNACRAVLIASAVAAAAFSQVAWGQTIVVPGPLAIDGDATANNLNLAGKIRSSQFTVTQSSQVVAPGSSSTTDLGAQTFCALSQVYIAGEDNHSSDTGACDVSLNTTTNKWTLSATLGGETNQVKCTAYCMSLPITTASGQDEMPRARRVRNPQ